MNSETVYRCPDCGGAVSQDMTHECSVTRGAYPGSLLSTPCTVRDIAPGSAFMTADGAMVLKSEYRLRPTDPESPAMCIIIGSGEYFHGERLDVHGDDVQVWPIAIHVVANTWRDKNMAYLRHALHEIITASFAWEDSAPVNWNMERKRWLKLRNIAITALQNGEETK